MKAVLVGLTALFAVIGLPSGHASATTLTTGSQVSPNTSRLLIGSGVTLGAVNNAPESTGANPSDPLGWDPWGSTDTNSQWLSVGGCCGGTSSAIFNVSGPAANNFSLLWGSPNSDNTITLWSGANGTGTEVATVTFVDGIGFYVDGVLSAQPYGPNTTGSGYIESIFTSTTLFESAVLTNDIGGFEVADVSASYLQTGLQSETPLPATLPLFATGLGGLGLLGWRRKRKVQAAA